MKVIVLGIALFSGWSVCADTLTDNLADRFTLEADMMPVVQSEGRPMSQSGLRKLTVQKGQCDWNRDAYTYTIEVDGAVQFEGKPESIAIPPFNMERDDRLEALYRGMNNDVTAVNTLFNFLASSGVHTFSANFDSTAKNHCETFVSVTHDQGSNLIRIYGPDAPVQFDVLLLLAQGIVRTASFDR